MQFHYLDTINSLPGYLSFLFDDERINAFEIDTTTIIDNTPSETLAYVCHLAESMGGEQNTTHTSILMEDVSLKFAPTRITSLRTGITSNNSRFEKVNLRKKNRIQGTSRLNSFID